MSTEKYLNKIENHFKELRKSIDNFAKTVKSEMEHDELEQQILKELKELKKDLKK